MTGILGIGVAVRDVTVWLSHHPAPDEKLPARHFSESTGGPVPGALTTLARLGRPGAFVGLVGDDPAGRLVRAELEGEGVDCVGLATREGFETPASVILVSGEHRTICEVRQETVPVGPEALAPVEAFLDRCRFLLVDGRMPDLQVEAARRVRAAGGAVVIDGGHARPGIDRLLPLTDVAILSHSHPATVDDLAGRLAPDGLRIAGLTLGAEGCVIRVGDGEHVRVPGHRVDVLDTTGAGDVFHGAFVAALLDGEDPIRAARFANAAAAEKCRGRTSRAPIPERDEIRRLAGLEGGAVRSKLKGRRWTR